MKGILCFAFLSALLPRVETVDVSNVGIVCQTHEEASVLADRYEMNTGTTYDSARDHYVETGACVGYYEQKTPLVARYEVVHGARGTYQVVEVADKKGKHFWGFATLYPDPSNDA